MADILVVDDDPAVRALLVLLSEQLGHDVREAATAEEALLRSAEQRPDLLLLDLMLPGRSGPELVRFLDRGVGRPRRMMLVSAMQPEVVADLAEEFDADYLCKPFRQEQFARAVEGSLAKLDDLIDLTAEERAGSDWG